MNNLFRITLHPKDNATDLNGYITNVLSRFPDGERFNVPRFIWVELAYAMDDGRRFVPYAPYLMFMIESHWIEISKRMFSHNLQYQEDSWC
jgi:hypothetical protein